MISIPFLFILALTLASYLYDEPAWPMPIDPYVRIFVKKFLECFLAISVAAAMAWGLSRLDYSSSAFIRFLAFAGFLGLGYSLQRRESLYVLFFVSGLSLQGMSSDLIAALTLVAEVSAGFILFRVAMDSIRARLLTVQIPTIFSGTPAFLICFWITAVTFFVSLGFLRF